MRLALHLRQSEWSFKMAEHKHGSMDVTEHEKTFGNFVKYGIYTVQAVIVAVLFLAIFNS